jgi:gamma-butyrobetaine dioxygenase
MGFPWAELDARGLVVIRDPSADLSPREAARAPWLFAERLLGVRPRMVERQPIKAVPGGRSFASSAGPAPLHTDSQMFAGEPPDVQVMVCARAADRGGEHVFVDGFALCDRVRDEDPDLYRLLFEAPRRIPFVFGDVFGPTVALRGDALTFTHSPRVLPGDPIAVRLARFVESAPVIELSTREGEILVAQNHRMLHGRRAFEGQGREYIRLLVWSGTPMAAPERHRAYAAKVAAGASARLASAPEAVRRRLGLTPPAARAASEARLAVVLEMLRGTPPGVLAAREGIPEPELYRMRDVALAAAEGALSRSPLPGDDEAVLSAISERA